MRIRQYGNCEYKHSIFQNISSLRSFSHSQMFKHTDIFFSQKIDFHTSCKLSHQETINMICQSLFSEKIRKTSLVCRLLNLPREW